MSPTFFGPSTRPLYGVFEEPSGRARKTGILLLYPGIQEYQRAHWAFRALASALAGRGYHVLRFDYRGFGDSAGEPEDATLDACVEDACVAAAELRDCAQVGRLALVGLRLGAAIAMRVSARLPFVRDLFLWNPVVDGAAYLEELEYVDQASRLQLLHPLDAPEGELGGHRFPREVRRSLERVDLREVEPMSATRVEIFTESSSRGADALAAALLRAGHDVATYPLGESSALASVPDAAMLAQGAISMLTRRIAETQS